MTAIKEHKINVPQEQIDLLNKKLDLAQYPSEIEDNPGWDFGSPSKDIKRIAEHWRNKFSWREHEKKLNELPNYETTVHLDSINADVDLHFLHQKSEVEGAIPLIFVHGWPGSYLEASKILPLLKGGEGKPAFHVVAPSVPNAGWSGRMLRRGFTVAKLAEAMHKLMLALGYKEYVTTGGDSGMLITRQMARAYPESVKAHHINWAWCGKPDFPDGEPEYSEREQKQLALAQVWGAGEGRGYLAIQATRPATINHFFRDSPVGLLAWIYDKLVDWSDDYPWTDDEVCLWVSLYVFSKAGPEAPTYLYYEATHDGSEAPIPALQGFIDVKLGITDFPVEIANMPQSWRHTMGPIVFQKLHDKGGHFGAYERPSEYAGDLCEMFGKNGGAAGVVKGHDGY